MTKQVWGTTVEYRLKDYKGYAVWKIIDDKGSRQEKITYMLQDGEDNNVNCFTSLNDLKKWTDNYTRPEKGRKTKMAATKRHKISDQKIREIAEEYGENANYLIDVMRDAENDGEDVDEEYVRDFLHEMYEVDDTCELVMER